MQLCVQVALWFYLFSWCHYIVMKFAENYFHTALNRSRKWVFINFELNSNIIEKFPMHSVTGLRERKKNPFYFSFPDKYVNHTGVLNY